MKKGEVYQAVVEELDFPNKGILHIDGEKVVVKNALPGQKIELLINKKRNGKCEGMLMEVLEKAPSETEAHLCPHFGICGGCMFQSIPYEAQLQMKDAQVRELMDRVCEDYVYEGIKASPLAEHYRNKMEFSFGDEYKDGPLALGMHRRGSFYDIVTLSECRLVQEDFIEILKATRAYFADLKISFYKKMKQIGYLRHLLVRRATKTGEILIDLVTTTQESPDLTAYKKMLLELPLQGKIVGILHTSNDSIADVVQSDRTDILYGQDFFYEELLGLTFKISPFSFFQTNSLGAEVLYETVRGYVGDTKGQIVFDLYSGTGTIAQMIAPVAKKVIGVEIVPEAVEAAKVNAKANGLCNCEFIAGDVLTVIDEIPDKPDLIILDPPRDGLHAKALDKIIHYGVEHLVYISCKPTSLARDLVILQAQGYRVERICAVDMFPSTANCETVVLLSKQKPDDFVKVEISLDELDATAAETKATYQEIKEYVLGTTSLKVSQLYIAQIKRKLGIIERENYNFSKSKDSKVPNCPYEKEQAIRAALKHFVMV